MKTTPKISIITIFRDEEEFISATLNSIRDQSFTEFECIMVDGGSTDNSAKIAEDYSNQDTRFKLVRQSSKGISNAFNQGVKESTGTYLIFMNGGDLFRGSHALSQFARYSNQNPKSIIACRSEYVSESGDRTNQFIPDSKPNPDKLQWHCSLSHQATLIPRDIFDRLGVFDENLTVAMDYDFWLRAYKNNVNFISFNDVLGLHRIGGVSFRQINTSRKEVIFARIRHLGLLRLSISKDIAQLLLNILENFKIYGTLNRNFRRFKSKSIWGWSEDNPRGN